MNRFNIIMLVANIILAIVIVTTASVYATFTDNMGTPPNGNTSAPINTSPAFQVKQGTLQLGGELQAPLFRDTNNGGYYLDPTGNSRVANVYSDYTYSYGAIDAPDVYLRNAGKWASQVRGVNGYCIQCRGRDSGPPGAACAPLGTWTNWSGTPGGSRRYEDVCQILVY